MSFKDQAWASRFDAMGDEAEGVFEYVAGDVLKLGYVRYGLNRPPLQMSALPARIRYTPDYLMSGKLVEVQGFGRDQRCKLKVDKWNSLHFWNGIHPLELFAWDTTNKRWCFVTLAQLDDLLAEATLDHFPEGKPFFSFPADALFDATLRQGEITDAIAA